jgi:hypothetical protein
VIATSAAPPPSARQSPLAADAALASPAPSRWPRPRSRTSACPVAHLVPIVVAEVRSSASRICWRRGRGAPHAGARGARRRPRGGEGMQVDDASRFVPGHHPASARQPPQGPSDGGARGGASEHARARARRRQRTPAFRRHGEPRGCRLGHGSPRDRGVRAPTARARPRRRGRSLRRGRDRGQGSRRQRNQGRGRSARVRLGVPGRRLGRGRASAGRHGRRIDRASPPLGAPCAIAGVPCHPWGRSVRYCRRRARNARFARDRVTWPVDQGRVARAARHDPRRLGEALAVAEGTGILR